MPGDELSAASLATLEVPDRLRALTTRREGLTTLEAAERFARCGPNVPVVPPRRHVVLALLSNFTNTLALLLWFAAGLAFSTGTPQLGGAILAVIGVNGMFAFLQEHRAERLVQVLTERVALQAHVVRDGVEQNVSATALVPGDIVRVAAGDVSPADCILLDADNLTADLSMLTGETLPAARTAQRLNAAEAGGLGDLASILPAGASVATGNARALVYATGSRSSLAQIATLAAGVPRGASLLEHQVATLARITATIAVIAGAAVLVVASLITRLQFLTVLTFATGVIVALVPEGLLPALSVSLALGAARMAARGAAVRRLSAVETIGSATVICTDKTGTLTLNSLAVRSATPADETAEIRELFERSLALCNDARPAEGGYAGDPLDVAIAGWLLSRGQIVEQAKARFARLRDVPFTAERRYMSVTCQDEGQARTFLKGAPETVMAETGLRPPPALASALTQAMERGDRALLVASCRSDGTDPRILGLVELHDPPRAEVRDAIAACHRAGVRVVMLTGDHPDTARAVAATVGLNVGPLATVAGLELPDLTDAALSERLQGDAICARIDPAQKLRIVSLLRRQGEIVVVTGDGVNDAPALRAADVGIAMGLRGTEVAKQAADIVLADDNFATIVAAVEEGRAIKANIRRFVSYVFTSNVAELAPFLAYLVLHLPLALTIMQALGISIGTDLLPALALGTEAAATTTMTHPPEPPDRPLLTLPLALRTFLLYGPIEAILGFASFFGFYLVHGWRPLASLQPFAVVAHQASTAAFLGVVGGQVGCLFSQREGRLRDRVNARTNIWILRGLAFELALTLLLIYVPGVNEAFSMTAVPVGLLLIVPLAAATFLGVDAVRRNRPRRLIGRSRHRRTAGEAPR